MKSPDRTGKRAALGALFAAILCALPPVLLVMFGAGVLAYLPEWLDIVLVPLIVGLGLFAIFRWWRARVASRTAE
ncbi:MAG: hypothetical protein P1U69_13090 [Parvibaculaceae bacterium]|nr:hypothetical protein [Parvibaculaceae bacterium]HBM87073.1 hypothetical protein [Rhodobiaceae bacterium]|tara:strand:+ start:564 stop:788 length:225 start_codon:yes stop_codon:yes gene_type:complete